jgi:hypothetical protein
MENLRGPFVIFVAVLVGLFCWWVEIYSVLWGKNKEDSKSETDKQRQETKEDFILKCITYNRVMGSMVSPMAFFK